MACDDARLAHVQPAVGRIAHIPEPVALVQHGRHVWVMLRIAEGVRADAVRKRQRMPAVAGRHKAQKPLRIVADVIDAP